MLYYNIQEVLDSLTLAKAAKMKTMTFDWEQIQFRGRYRLFRACRKHGGRVKRRLHGFVVYL